MVVSRPCRRASLGHSALRRTSPGCASGSAAAFRGREFGGNVSFIAPLVEPGRINARGQRSSTDVDVVEVLVDLVEPDVLAVGMKVDVYFRPDAPQRQ